MIRVSRSFGVLLLGAACNRPVPSGASHASGAGNDPNARVTTSSYASPAVSEQAPSPAPALPDGCFAGIDGGLDARPLLAALAEGCTAGMQPLWPEPIVLELSANGRRELPVVVEDVTRCLRVVAAGGPGVEELELSVLDSRGSVLGQDDLPGAFALVEREGPVCVAEPGTYRVVTQLARGRGQIALQVYQAVASSAAH